MYMSLTLQWESTTESVKKKEKKGESVLTHAPIDDVTKVGFLTSERVPGVLVDTAGPVAREAASVGGELTLIVHRRPTPRGMRWLAQDHLPV